MSDRLSDQEVADSISFLEADMPEAMSVRPEGYLKLLREIQAGREELSVLRKRVEELEKDRAQYTQRPAGELIDRVRRLEAAAKAREEQLAQMRANLEDAITANPVALRFILDAFNIPKQEA